LEYFQSGGFLFPSGQGTFCPFTGLAAAIVVSLTGTAVRIAVTAAGENENKDNHPGAVVTTKEVTHIICLLSKENRRFGASDFRFTIHPMPILKIGYSYCVFLKKSKIQKIKKKLENQRKQEIFLNFKEFLFQNG